MRFGKANFKRAVSAILAASLIFSVTPVTAFDAAGEAEIMVTDVPVIGEENIPVESETEVVTETTVPEISETSETVTDPLDFIDDENDFSFFSAAASAIQLSKVSETDSSISISWSGVYGETFSHYEVYCNGAVVQTGMTDTAYTVTGLAGGNEYGISVYAYDIEGNVIGMSDTEYYYTNWNVSGDTVLTSDKIVSNLYINSGTLNLNGHTLTVKGNVCFGENWNTSYLNINKGQLYVDGNFNMCQTNGNGCYGYLTMTNAEDYVCVNGNFYIYTYYNYSSLTNGTLEVKGNFTQKQYGYADNFNPGGNHRVLLSGESLQTVNFAKTESRFNILEVRNYSAEGVVFSTPVTMNKYIDNGCNVTFSNGERTGWTLEADETIEGDVNLSRGTLDLNGHKLTITGNLIHSGGTVLVNGGELEVQGDYRVQALNGTSYTNSTGVLNMTNEADTVKVMGQFVMQSTASHSGKLTAGTLEIGGNLTQAGANSYNFCTSGSHTVILNGTEKQSVSIANYGKDNSRFNNLKITNTSIDGVDFPRTAYVVGNLYNTETKITNGANLVLTGTFADNVWSHDIWLNENRTLNEDLEIGGNLYLNGGTLNLNGHTLTVKGNVYLSASGSYTYLNVNKGKLYVDGSFNMRRTNGNGCYGYLTMTNAEDYVCVNGDFYVYSYYNSNLSNGTLEVKGNFTQRLYGYGDNFAPNGNHKVILSGEGLQTVNFTNIESRFNILEIQNYSDEGVVFKTTATIGELIDNGCNVSFANGERSGWTLEADETIEGDVNLSRGTLDLNGHKLTITGNLIHSGGTVLVNGGELEVQGDYRVQALNGTNYTNSTGVLNMTNEADTVMVMGQFVMQSTASHSGKLTAGTLEIGGNLTQAGANSYNFCTSGSHTVILNGTEKQSISINDNYRDYSRFNNLKITNTSAEGVTFSRMAYVVGNLYNTETKITNGSNIYVPSTMKFADNAWNHDIWICENRTLSEDLEIGGTLYLNGGTLNLNGHTLTVKGNVYLSNAYLNVNKGKLYVDGNFNMSYTNGSGCSGYLTMTNAEDYICISGDLYVASYYNYSSLTNGTIEVKGNFTQKHTSYPNNFVPSGNHKVIFSGEGLQTVSFDRTESRFNILEIQNYSDEGVVFKTTVTIGELIDNGCNVSFANGERSGWTLEADETIEGDVNLARGTLDLNGHKLTITGNLIHSGGTVLVNGGELEVQGDYRVQALNGTSYTNSTGVLNMTNEADTVRVMGQFVMQSTASHNGKLTAGTLEIGGNLTQAGANSYNFCTSGSHTVILNGTEKQTVSIANYNRDYSRFNNLKITNTSVDGVDFATIVYVVGNLYNTETNVKNGFNIYVPTSMKFADNAWNHNIRFVENRTLYDDLHIGGVAVFDGGTFDLNGHTMTVDSYVNLWGTTLNINKGQLLIAGDFNFGTAGSYSNGRINMKSADDYILVNGNMMWYPYYSHSGYLTAGTLEVKGNFTQKYSYYTNNFAPSGNHKVILSGGKLQKVDFATIQSYFNILEITKPLDTGYVFSRTPLWNELIEGKADTEAPTAPKNLKFVRSNSSSIAMTWSASSDNAAVYCYYIYRNGERVGNTTKTEYIDNDLKSHTSYEYYIVACDTSGNLSEWSNILEASTDVDAFAPTQPANLAAKIQSEGVVRLSWTASSDNGTVVKYNVYRNGTLIGSSNGTAFTDSTAFGGYYEYYVEAVDNEDNVSRASASVFIDNLAPSAPVLTLNSVKEDNVSLSWECSDNVAVSKYDLYRNDVKIKSFNANMYIDTAVSLDTNYTYYVVAYDAAGNVSENSNEVTVYTGEDDVAPVISSIEYTGKPSFKNTVITVSATDNCGVSKIYLKYSTDKINWTDCGSEIASGKASVTVKFGVDTSEMTDGTVYLCAYAEDINGNVSAIENSPTYSFTVDNTAPDAPTNVTLSLKNSQIEIRWTAPNAEDTAYFKVYRKTSDSDYMVIKDNHKYLNSFDTDIGLGTEYTYCVTAVDKNGNESLKSEEVTGGVTDDNVKPEILSVYPESGAALNTNQLVGISAKDNFRLESITVECRPENGDWTTVFEEDNINIYAKAVQFELDTSSFATGRYEIRAYATDKAGNVSEYTENSYTFKECALSAPVLTAVGEGWRSELSWTMENTEDLLGYHVYRKTSKIGNYSCIASIKNSEYTDSDLTPDKTYYYMVEAIDSRNNTVKSNEVTSIPTNNDDILPLADAGADTMGIAGEAISFNGSNSWDNHYVASYEWNFGDGTTAEGVRVSHSYENDGTYDVTLTVKDSAGNSDSHTVKAHIYSNDYGTVQLKTVLKDTNTSIGNVKVYCDIAGVDSSEFMTDANGNFKLIAPKGTYDIYFYKNEYLPQHASVKVTGETSSLKIEIEKKDLVEGKLTVRPLDVNEMIALGIDVNAPENQFVYEYEIDYDKDGKISFTLDATGDLIGEVNLTYLKERKGRYTTVMTLKGESGRSVYGSSGGYATGSGGIPVSVAVFNVTTQLSWLKQFYEVELTIINNADDDFSIQNSKAVLNLPDGLSLANTDRKENLTQIMGNKGVIGGKETEHASWIVRGDKAGSYDLSAEFTGVLMPLNEDVKVIFKTEEPLVVNDGTGLRLDITVTEGLDYWTNKFTFMNNRELINPNDEDEIKQKSIYNFAASFSGSAQLAEFSAMYIEYPDGTVEIAEINNGVPDLENSDIYLPVLSSGESIYDHRTIKPGESVTGYFSIYRRDGFTNDN